MEERTCPTCGAELKAEVLGGLCPQCELHTVMAEEAARAGAEAPETISVPVPPVLKAVTEEPGDRIGRYKLVQRLDVDWPD